MHGIAGHHFNIVDPTAVAGLVFVSFHDLSSASSRPSLPRTGYDNPLTLRTDIDLPRKSGTVSDFFRRAGGSRFNKFLRFT
jgi:hypothetical protein